MAPAVPETVLRKRKRDEQWAAKKAAAAAEVCCVVLQWISYWRTPPSLPFIYMRIPPRVG